MKHNRASLALGITSFSTLVLVCCGLFFIASAEGNLPAVTEAPAAGGGVAYFINSGPENTGLVKVSYIGGRCERERFIAWLDDSIVSAENPAAGLPFTITNRRIEFPAPLFCRSTIAATP